MIRNTQKYIYIVNILSEVLAKAKILYVVNKQNYRKNLNKATGLNYILSYSAPNSPQHLYETFFYVDVRNGEKIFTESYKILTARMLFVVYVFACMLLTYA